MVSVLTPTIKGREHYLAECRASVVFQTSGHWEHLRLVDTDHQGCAATMNALAAEALGTWLLPLADDDLLLPGCIKALLGATGDADVVYPVPLVWGMEPGTYQQAPPAIPSLALIRRTLWERLGGYDTEWQREEDRRLWIRAMATGARFVRYDAQPTWVYRFHGANKSLHGGQVVQAAGVPL
jgi:glycosyltransferase involved in cell wall biosynthesis